ncbi:Cro/Cl family transcriptional regulator [Paraburkholderia sp. CNPSo 3157]|uniref:Cro/Cl family transcriptional regulator n=1 Tax=Paraburkholderia franconis TaxID=2654983 RepID=A0A7X1TG72_9BURK|nr:YdaS family helix-turn-helix protein [Paraburkholderia franconis]MPW17909.1 Cro/Cl family transcriptional regulator [Paraburkholderia franconis]
MDKLLAYLNSLSTEAQRDFAARCGTTIGYLRKAISAGQQLGESLCINIDRESGGVVRCEDLAASVDWAYLRNSMTREAA